MENPDPIQQLSPPVEISFQQGTLEVVCKNEVLPNVFPWLRWDQRSQSHRCHAYRYRDLIRYLFKNKIRYSDSTPKYKELSLLFKSQLTPFDYQAEALNAWCRSKRGITVLPTGAGKSYLAALVTQTIQRSTLVIAPTIDLILQWQQNLSEWFDCPVGLLGGGSFDIQEVTVATYDSARIHAENIGNRFGL